MKTPGYIRRFLSGRAITASGLAIAALPFVSAPSMLAGQPASPPAATTADTSASKPYAIYMGADLSIEWKGKLYSVRDVEGANFVIDVDGKTTKVPTTIRDLKIKIDPMIKVSAAALTVSDFKPERVFSAEADPARHFAEGARMAFAASQMADMATSKFVYEQSSLGWMQNHPEVKPDDGGYTQADIGAQQAVLDASGSALDNAFHDQIANAYAMGDAVGRAEADAAAERFDAFRVTFQIAAKNPVPNPYAIVILRIRPDANNPKSMIQWVYAQKIAALGTEPQKMEIFHKGFPPGYELLDAQLHVYQNGVELDTSLGNKRKGLSAAEAFQFAVADYVYRNREMTAEPVPNRKFAPTGLMFPAKGSNQTYYVKVAKNGLPLGAFTDRECTQKVDDSDVVAAVMRLRFNPALNKGKPVEGIAVVRPTEI
jgi:hypothetical protein